MPQHIFGPVARTDGLKKKDPFRGYIGERWINIFQEKICISKGMAMRAEKGRFFCETPSEGFSATRFWTCRPNRWLEKVYLVIHLHLHSTVHKAELLMCTNRSESYYEIDYPPPQKKSHFSVYPQIQLVF